MDNMDNSKPTGRGSSAKSELCSVGSSDRIFSVSTDGSGSIVGRSRSSSRYKDDSENSLPNTAETPTTHFEAALSNRDGEAKGHGKVSRISTFSSLSPTPPGDQGAESSAPTWSQAELLEVRARERTFDGAYWRTSIGLFGASLVILRVFGLAFFPVGLVFLALALGFLAIGLVRRRKLLNQDTHARGPFVTSGSTVLLSGAMCLSAYVVLIVLLLRM
ncbi:hypothetical protein BX661DRAFT_176071 [Kickxella alabastrina]|uniref:uncharacterized protein n=1 Tax=Kickxella alabastrina TaxID=61397 RepID=UPI0022205760|nr:uncharacterized protein BX661DRAFT_176071 [Kickxella alabastrina]KAI7835096.1 hypothetical protein BX661DRAFT_176071 [Kickxella alabastrina]